MPLYFPGSEPTADVDPNTVVFRDGPRQIAPYLAVLMGALDTERYTYEEALAAVNKGLLTDVLSRAQNDAVDQHLKTWGGG